MKRVNNVLIGKDIARTASLDISATGSQNLAEGEVFVADKNKELLSAGATIADTDTVYIGVGTSETYNYTDPSGSAVTGVRKIKWSSPIEGKGVKNFKGLEADSMSTEKKVTIDIDSASSFAPTDGEEYVIRLVFSSVSEHPGQFVQDYRVTADGTGTGDLTDDFVKVINNYEPSLVTASNVSDDLVIEANDVSADGADAIDEYRQVQFYAFLSSDNFEDVEVTVNNNPHPGHGNPKLVRDKEKHAQGYEGITSRFKFPVVKPDLSVDMDKWYDAIVIEHDNSYVAADNDYIKESSLTTEVYIPINAGQTTEVLAALNPWMASLPKGFSNVSV